MLVSLEDDVKADPSDDDEALIAAFNDAYHDKNWAKAIEPGFPICRLRSRDSTGILANLKTERPCGR